MERVSNLGPSERETGGFPGGVPPGLVRQCSLYPAEDKAANAEAQPAPGGPQQAPDGTQRPAGHPPAATGQGATSKCPFLAAQMSQRGSSVVRKASLALQEDVQEMHAVREGNSAGPGRGRLPLGACGPRMCPQAVMRAALG